MKISKKDLMEVKKKMKKINNFIKLNFIYNIKINVIFIKNKNIF